MRSAINSVDVVGETEDTLGVTVVVLQRYFDFDLVSLSFHQDRLVVQDGLAAIEMLYKLRNSTCITELGTLRVPGFRVHSSLIGERDLQALVQESQFAQALR